MKPRPFNLHQFETFRDYIEELTKNLKERKLYCLYESSRISKLYFEQVRIGYWIIRKSTSFDS